MNRFTYVVTPAERLLGVALPPDLPPPLRLPLAALALSLLLVGAGCGAQQARLGAAERAAASYAERLAECDVAAAHVRVLTADVRRLRDVAHRLDEARASGGARATDVAAIGNGIPSDAWLTSMRVDAHELGIDGRGRRLDAVGATMAALVRLPAYRAARLLAVHSDTARSGVSYAIALESAR